MIILLTKLARVTDQQKYMKATQKTLKIIDFHMFLLSPKDLYLFNIIHL
jgi:hypothetical protein